MLKDVDGRHKEGMYAGATGLARRRLAKRERDQLRVEEQKSPPAMMRLTKSGRSCPGSVKKEYVFEGP